MTFFFLYPKGYNFHFHYSQSKLIYCRIIFLDLSSSTKLESSTNPHTSLLPSSFSHTIPLHNYIIPFRQVFPSPAILQLIPILILTHRLILIIFTFPIPGGSNLVTYQASRTANTVSLRAKSNYWPSKTRIRDFEMD